MLLDMDEISKGKDRQLKERADDLEQRKKQLLEKDQQLEGKNKQLNERHEWVQKFEGSIDSLQNQLKQRDSLCANHERELQALREARDKSSIANERLTAELASLKSRKAYPDQVTHCDNCPKLQDKLASSLRRGDEAEKAADALRLENTRLRGEIKASNARNDRQKSTSEVQNPSPRPESNRIPKETPVPRSDEERATLSPKDNGVVDRLQQQVARAEARADTAEKKIEHATTKHTQIEQQLRNKYASDAQEILRRQSAEAASQSEIKLLKDKILRLERDERALKQNNQQLLTAAKQSKATQSSRKPVTYSITGTQTEITCPPSAELDVVFPQASLNSATGIPSPEADPAPRAVPFPRQPKLSAAQKGNYSDAGHEPQGTDLPSPPGLPLMSSVLHSGPAQDPVSGQAVSPKTPVRTLRPKPPATAHKYLKPSAARSVQQKQEVQQQQPTISPQGSEVFGGGANPSYFGTESVNSRSGIFQNISTRLTSREKASSSTNAAAGKSSGRDPKVTTQSEMQGLLASAQALDFSQISIGDKPFGIGCNSAVPLPPAPPSSGAPSNAAKNSPSKPPTALAAPPPPATSPGSTPAKAEPKRTPNHPGLTSSQKPSTSVPVETRGALSANAGPQSVQRPSAPQDVDLKNGNTSSPKLNTGADHSKPAPKAPSFTKSNSPGPTKPSTSNTSGPTTPQVKKDSDGDDDMDDGFKPEGDAMR